MSDAAPEPRAARRRATRMRLFAIRAFPESSAERNVALRVHRPQRPRDRERRERGRHARVASILLMHAFSFGRRRSIDAAARPGSPRRVVGAASAPSTAGSTRSRRPMRGCAWRRRSFAAVSSRRGGEPASRAR
jgi:hypothetical protein